MKKTLLSTALVAVMAAVAFAPTAQATDGTISFTGQINAATCTINNGTPDFTVQLPTVATTTLAAHGNTAGQTQFKIELSGCTSGTNASAFFEQGANVDPITGNLISTGGASNVQLQLLNSNGTSVINLLNPSTNTTTADVSTGSGTLTYYVQYFATAASSAGSVSGTEQYTIAYQ
jgi:major type 1 subunit fimbrin (pilin)